eukprot:4952313-Lingulodinium_polyedra.AAC.1
MRPALHAQQHTELHCRHLSAAPHTSAGGAPNRRNANLARLLAPATAALARDSSRPWRANKTDRLLRLS